MSNFRMASELWSGVGMVGLVTRLLPSGIQINQVSEFPIFKPVVFRLG